MNSTQLLKNLFDHMFWADAEVWNIIFDNNHKVEKDEKIKEKESKTQKEEPRGKDEKKEKKK